MTKPKELLLSGKTYLQDQLFHGKSFWFILFLTLLAVIAIRASHSVDEKVLKISVLENNLKELEAEYLESKSKLMQLGMESQVTEKGKDIGLIPSSEPTQASISEMKPKDDSNILDREFEPYSIGLKLRWAATS